MAESLTMAAARSIFAIGAVALAAVTTLGAHPFDGGGPPFHELESFDFLKSGDPLVDWNPAREWTSSDGRKLTAKLVQLRGEIGMFVPAGGKKTKIPLFALSKDDQQFVAEWSELSNFFNTAYEEPRNLAGNVKSEMFEGEFAREGTVHETRHFRFECDVPLRATVAKDLSKLFEVTHTAVAELPLGLSLARPDGKKILVRLFSSEPDYIAAGGSKEAAGVYKSKEQVVLVPLASLGLELGKNGEIRKTRDFDPSTLIHETTHAVTHRFLEHLPLWFAEGLAEYVAAMPYRDGVLDRKKHADGLRALAAKKFGGEAERFELFEPRAFVHLEGAAFMGEPQVRERPIVLRPVKPFQIELVQPGAPTAVPGAVSVIAVRTEELTPIKPLFGKPDNTIVRRYVSSMLLVQHLLESDPAALRRYLFSLLHGEWSVHHYLNEWNEAIGLHNDAVQGQISDFKEELDRFHADVSSFNAAVTRHNAGEIVTIPNRPVVPVPPKAVPVPEILAKPKSTSELSQQAMRKRSLAKHLKLPDQVQLPK